MHDTSPWCSVSPKLCEFALSLKPRFVSPLLTAVGILPHGSVFWGQLAGFFCCQFFCLSLFESFEIAGEL